MYESYACARHITSIIDYISLRKNVDILNQCLPSHPTIHSTPCPTYTIYPHPPQLLVLLQSLPPRHRYGHGHPYAPYHANLFMGHLEQDFLNSKFDKLGLWLRFIDMFLLWPHGPNCLERLNSRYPIHFTSNTYSSHSWMSIYT